MLTSAYLTRSILASTRLCQNHYQTVRIENKHVLRTLCIFIMLSIVRSIFWDTRLFPYIMVQGQGSSAHQSVTINTSCSMSRPPFRARTCDLGMPVSDASSFLSWSLGKGASKCLYTQASRTILGSPLCCAVAGDQHQTQLSRV